MPAYKEPLDTRCDRCQATAKYTVYDKHDNKIGIMCDNCAKRLLEHLNASVQS